MVVSDSDDDCTPLSSSLSPLRGAASTTAIDVDSPQPVRRSSRVRSRATAAMVVDVPDSPLTSGPRRLEQIPYSSTEELGLQNEVVASMRVEVHPVAMMLMNVHAHLTRMEVIGYLGGAVYHPRERPGETVVIVAEAFATKALTDKDLARTGRNAYMEVEMNPESSVEVLDCIQAKGLQVVGWYHSHPDSCFTVEPSRVDIENQDNYQRLLFKERPFVAAIIAPYNEDLPDHCSALEFFSVWGGEIPLRLPYAVDTLVNVPSSVLPGYWRESERSYPLSTVKDECRLLVDEHKESIKRVRLANEWRGGRSCVDKLRGALMELVEICKAYGEMDTTKNVAMSSGEAQSGLQTDDDIQHANSAAHEQIGAGPSTRTVESTQAESFRQCVDDVIDHAEGEYSISAERERLMRAEKRRKSASQRVKRTRRR